MNMEEFDIAIIGSGPGGYVAAIRSAQLGYKTALIEKYGTLGGTCTNVGCIPAKALLDSTHHYSDAMKNFSRHGIEFSDVKLNFEQLYKRKGEVVRKNTQGLEFLMKKNKITVLRGTASFISSKQVRIVHADSEETLIRSKKYIIATGSKPATIAGVAIDKERIITSTEALDMKKKPQSIAIIGGGVIGVEMASIFNRIGTKVTILEYADNLIANMDRELGSAMAKILAKQGVEIRLEQAVFKAENLGDMAKVYFRSKQGGQEELIADYVLVAVGRKAFTADLGLENTDVALNTGGTIRVNELLETDQEGIYAIGDVIGGAMLAHKAEEEAIFVIERIDGQKPHIDYNRIPSVVYTWPEAASVGATEEELQKKGIAYQVGRFPFSANARARAGMDEEGFAKVLSDPKYGELLGVHVIGARAADLIAQAVTGLEYEVTAKDMASICYAHPTYSEVMKEAYRISSGEASINI
ncbi:dihydrolipoamide dehydrogenase [Flavobacterium phragmitis]|uniref:Dihydrolipoyl dehydrogenase n=2 Tax=Flavobacterium phragmitis TaxID=739143 RepID=A0A1I1U7G8_9FLAO|nr:dihydrolipoamide dehydrogenase [Flavobacterium phragmitis]